MLAILFSNNCSSWKMASDRLLGATMRIKILCFALSAGLIGMISPSLAGAAPITVPSGAAPGSTYFLAFVTAGFTAATSSDIAYYDAFVAAEAAAQPELAALATTWRAIASTATFDPSTGTTLTVNAVTHIAVTGPVYNLRDQEVASGSADLFDGDTEHLIRFTASGAVSNINFTDNVWTGSDVFGMAIPIHTLGAFQPEYGEDSGGTSGTGNWIAQADDQLFGNEFRLNGISGPLTVPETPVPEPSSVLLFGTGILGVSLKR